MATANGNIDLGQRAMLSHLALSAWTPGRNDKAGRDIIVAAQGSSPAYHKAVKCLIDPGVLCDVTAAQGKVRAAHYRYTLPWLDNGARILPVALLMRYEDEVGAARREFEAAVSDFVWVKYPAAMRRAEYEQGAAYDPAAYPSQESLARKFASKVTYLPIPQADDFRVDLDGPTVAAIKSQCQDDMMTAARTVTQNCIVRIQDVVGKMVEGLSAYNGDDRVTGKRGPQKGDFKGTLVTNIADLIDVLPGLNITDDATVRDAINAMRELVRADHTALKADPTLRKDVRNEAQAILDRMAGYMGEAA